MKLNFIIFFVIILGLQYLHCEDPLDINISLENGYFQSETLGDRLLIRFIGRLNYFQKFENSYINIKGRLSPELYGSSLDATAYKFNGEMNLGGIIKSYAWLANIATRNYYYRSDRFSDVTFNTFQLGFNISRPISKNKSLGLNIEYYYRDNAEPPRSELDNYRIALTETFRINTSNFISVDMMLEKFLISRDSTFYELNENEGIRWGPIISFDYRSKLLVNASYELIHHQSDLFNWNYWEHRIHFLGGIYITKKWSVFLFVNYLFRPDKHPEEGLIELAYTPANNETGYHFKLGYDLNAYLELYAKTGYTKDELLYQSTELAGWQYLIGMNFRF